MQESWSLYLLAIVMLGLDSKLAGEAFQPEFAEPITNLTVPIGRDATFRCLVHNLGGYRVGWVRADTKAIQAIHVHVITNNQRVGVSHNGQTVWNLHIRDVQEEDRGQYMCQINTDPMQSQMGYLDVVIPPDFIEEETSGDVIVSEGGTVRVSCRARGIPEPLVVWKREDGEDIVIRDTNGNKNKVSVFDDETLTLHKISRSDMGAYLCIASNGVPPTISKRIMIKVHFPPVLQIPNQLVGAPLNTDVTLECYAESSPKSIYYWVKIPNEMVILSDKYEVVNTMVSSFENRMTMTIRNLAPADLGGYRCIAKNSLGETDGAIRVYEIPGPSISNTDPTTKDDFQYSTPLEGPDNQFGSAEKSDDEDDKETIINTMKIQNYHLTNDGNRMNLQTNNSLTKQNISNKVSKIINKLEIEAQDIVSKSSGHTTSILRVLVFTVFVIFTAL